MTATPNFEARATVAVDTANRVWVAWEEGEPNWGKDNGFTIRATQPGVGLGGVRARHDPRLRWRQVDAARMRR